MPITIDTDQCEQSGVCSLVCPEDVIENQDGRPVIINNVACTSCWKCAEFCVAGAIDVE